MEKLNLFDVDKDYIKKLQQEETKLRGFTHVPNMDYPGREQKFLCGIVLKIENIDYYVPCSSFKTQKPDNLLIVFDDDRVNPIKGSLRFNYMIPVPKQAIQVRIIKNEPNPSRKLFLQKQLDFMNINRDTIYRLAERTYKRVINKYNPFLCKNSCDFKLLEKVCLTYENIKQNTLEEEKTPFNDILIQLHKQSQQNHNTKDHDSER